MALRRAADSLHFYGSTPPTPNLGNQAPLRSGVAQNFTVVATKAVSGSWPDLPRYPSHTPNELQGALI